MAHAAPGCLYIVSTPIGNLGDITLRAVETLRDVSAILAEDTRHSQRLLSRYEIRTPLESYREHNEARMTPAIVARMEQGERFALITDAGTPILSDPGLRLVRAAIAAGIPVTPIPGASALLAAVVAAGVDMQEFTFLGFLPRKGRERREAMATVIGSPRAVVLYESPNRVGATLRELAQEGAGAREAVVGRELTKQFEEFRRGTVNELAEYYEREPARGEVVIVVGGAAPVAVDEQVLREAAARLREDGASPRDIIRLLMEEHRASRNMAYRIAHE